MKILLISSNICVDPYPVYPLGMSVIARTLHEAGETVTQFDILTSGLDGLRKLLEENVFDVIGISIRNIDLVNSVTHDEEIIQMPMKIIRVCRELSAAFIFLGGSGFSLLPEVIMACSGADSGIAGEGEDAVLALLRDLKQGIRPPALIRMRSGRQRPPLFDPDILDFYFKKNHMIPLQTKRGCPCKCAYCTYPALEGKIFRHREENEIFSQIREYRKKYPDGMFFFVDSLFNDPRGEFRDFLRNMKRECGFVPFSCFTTPWRLTEEDIDLLCDCGMVSTDLGVDATTDTTLKGICKYFSFDDVRRCIKKMLSRQVGAACSVMIGGPGETYETIREGIENLHSLKPASVVIFSGIRILPGTALYEHARGKGKIPADWNGIDSLFYFEDGLDPEKVHGMLMEAFGKSANIIYPPDRQNKILRTIHKIGYLNFRDFVGGNGYTKDLQ